MTDQPAPTAPAGLREAVKKLEPTQDENGAAGGWYFDGWYEARQAVLDIIDAALASPSEEPGLDVETLTTVLYDWMPDGADLSLGFDGDSIHLTGGDLARYIFDRATEYARLAEEPGS